MALTFNSQEWEKIHYANECLKRYYKAIELENRAKQADLSGMSYSGMPSSPSPGNYQEDKMVDKADKAYKYHEYLRRIKATLDDVIWVENPMWYKIIVGRYIKKDTNVKIYMDLHISRAYYNQKLNQALLHFYDSCNLNINIFDE